MTPAARAQAAIELLDEIIAAARGRGPAADTLIARYFKTRRYAGSKDRRAVRELVYRAIRRAAERPASGRAALLRSPRASPSCSAAFDGSPHGRRGRAGRAEPRPRLDARPGCEAARSAASTADERPALLERAPLDLRVNRLKARARTRSRELPEAAPTPLVADRAPASRRLSRRAAPGLAARAGRDPGRRQPALASPARPRRT